MINTTREHEIEPIPGLPEDLPRGERILWQGRPNWKALAIDAFHLRAIALYFGVIALWQTGNALVGSGTFNGLIGLAVTFALVAGLLGFIAWGMARQTLYTVTSKRLVIRHGIAIQKSVNLPFKVIDGASLAVGKNGRGNLPLELNGKERLSYLIMWPHVRPWRFGRVQPMIRAVDGIEKVGDIVAGALQTMASENVGAKRTASETSEQALVSADNTDQPRLEPLDSAAGLRPAAR